MTARPTKYDRLLSEQADEVRQALTHLKYSYRKVLSLQADPRKLTTEQLETWEAFVARFARLSDIFLSRYVRTFVLKGDAGFRGSFRDFLDQAEKGKLIDSAESWMNVRELRNQSAHEYAAEKLAILFDAIRNEAPRLLALEKSIPCD
jgi:hypothetical protein